MALANTVKKSQEMVVNPEVVEVYTIQKDKTHRKAQKKLLKNKRIPHIKMSAKRSPVFTFSLPGEATRPCPMSVTPLLIHVRCCT